MNDVNAWPNDADGDVLRVLKERNFDFTVAHEVEFNIDFKHWPLKPQIKAQISEMLPDSRFIDIEEAYLEPDEPPGYVLTKVKGFVNYDFVIQEQQRLTQLFAELDGVCESWAVCSPCGG